MASTASPCGSSMEQPEGVGNSGVWLFLSPQSWAEEEWSNALPHSSRLLLFDDLVRAHLQRLRYLEAERLGGLQVDDRLKLRRLRDGDVGRVRALQYLVNENSGAAKHGGEVYPVPYQCAPPGRDDGCGNRWHAALVDNRRDQRRIGDKRIGVRDDETVHGGGAED